MAHPHLISSLNMARKYLFVVLMQQHASGLSCVIKIKKGCVEQRAYPYFWAGIAHGLENHGFKEGVPMLPGLSQSFIPPCHVPF